MTLPMRVCIFYQGAREGVKEEKGRETTLLQKGIICDSFSQNWIPFALKEERRDHLYLESERE